jgi:hypothetical protein
MIEGLTFKVLHDASPEATPAEGQCNMNACQLGDPVGKKPHSAAAHRFSFGNRGDQKPRGKDEVGARLVSKDRIDFDNRGRPTPVPTYDVLPMRPQGLLSEFRRGVHGDQSREAMRRRHARSLTPERAVTRTMGSIDLGWADFRKVAPAARRSALPLLAAADPEQKQCGWPIPRPT